MPRGIPNSTLIERETPLDEPIISPVSAPVHIIGDIGKKYYWSSQAHTGYLRGHVTLFPFTRPEWTDLPDDPMQKQMARRQKEAHLREYPNKEDRDRFDRALAELGTNSIPWNYVSGPSNGSGQSMTGFVWYATDSDDIAFVIREDLKRGHDGQFIKETPQDTFLRVGNAAYANNDLARKLAFEEMERSGNPIVPEKKAS